MTSEKPSQSQGTLRHVAGRAEQIRGSEMDAGGVVYRMRVHCPHCNKESWVRFSLPRDIDRQRQP